MADTENKVVALDPYIKARDLLNNGNVEALLAEQRANLRILDAEAFDLLTEKHKLKDTIFYKGKAIKYGQDITLALDWLDDKINETTNEKDKEAKRLLRTQFEQLSARNERIKKDIESDLVDCRFEVLKSFTVAGFLGSLPLTGAALARLLTDKPIVIFPAALAGEIIAIGLVFHDQARDFGGRAKKAIMESPRKFQSAKKRAHNSAFAATLTIPIAVKQINEIEPRYSPRSVNRSQALMVVNR